MKTALITGVTGQDGAYLAELLLKKIHDPDLLCEKIILPAQLNIRSSTIPKSKLTKI